MESLTDKELLARLVAFDTTSATVQPTKPLGDFVCEYLDLPGVRTERFDCGNDQENILFSAGPECSKGEGLLLSGHVDCVPATEPEWTSDPFTLVEHEDRFVGRGSCDMKGFDAIAINTLRMHAIAADLTEPLAVVLSCNEEIGTIGAGQFVEQWGDRPLPRRTIVGEPTSLKPIRGHKGHMSFTIAIGGRGGHTGFPKHGSNALEHSIPVLQGLKAFREQLVEERAEWSELFPEVPQAVLTVAMIEGGSAINVIPETCIIRIGIRPLPGQSAEKFATRLLKHIPESQRVDASKVKAPGDGEVLLALTNCTPSYGLASDNPFLAEVKAVVGETPDCGANYGTDAGRLEALGCHSVVLGPGDISVAHKPNEWMPRSDFEHMPKILEQLVR